MEQFKIVDISAGSLHNAALTVDGKVVTWGCNDHGRLLLIVTPLSYFNIYTYFNKYIFIYLKTLGTLGHFTDTPKSAIL